MLDIGIETDLDLFYEGRNRHGRAIWPNPIVTPAKVVLPSEGPLRAEQASDVMTACRFREDYFDPISHVRRGRFYAVGKQQPVEWHVQPHPAFPQEGLKADALGVLKVLHTFHGFSFRNRYLNRRTEQPLILLGLDDRFSIWTVINLEVISTGEELVTLKARRGIGVLPVIETASIPEGYLEKVQESLESFVDEVHRAAPISVIDRARDAASQVLIARYGVTGRRAPDLSKLATRLAEEERYVAANAAKIIALLHARGKPSERTGRPGMRAIREEDAQLATQCLGTLLCELGWAEWQ